MAILLQNSFCMGWSTWKQSLQSSFCRMSVGMGMVVNIFREGNLVAVLFLPLRLHTFPCCFYRYSLFIASNIMAANFRKTLDLRPTPLGPPVEKAGWLTQRHSSGSPRKTQLGIAEVNHEYNMESRASDSEPWRRESGFEPTDLKSSWEFLLVEGKPGTLRSNFHVSCQPTPFIGFRDAQLGQRLDSETPIA